MWGGKTSVLHSATIAFFPDARRRDPGPTGDSPLQGGVSWSRVFAREKWWGWPRTSMNRCVVFVSPQRVKAVPLRLPHSEDRPLRLALAGDPPPHDVGRKNERSALRNKSIFPGRASARSGTDGGLSAARRVRLVPGLRPGKMMGVGAEIADPPCGLSFLPHRVGRPLRLRHPASVSPWRAIHLPMMWCGKADRTLAPTTACMVLRTR
jgi:hypothetical protein